MQWHDVLGSAGAAVIVITYFLLQLGRISSTALTYSVLNAIGAFLILVSLWIDFNLSAFLVEAFWLAISALGIIRWSMGKTRQTHP